MSFRFRLPVIVLLAIGLVVHADEAVRGDGSRHSGRLTLTETGRFTFRAGDRDEPIAGLDLVRFTSKTPSSASVGLWHQILLGHGEVLLAEVLKLDATHLYVRPVWADSLAVPRAAIERVTHEPGWRTVLFDSFDNGLSAWKKTGEPRADAGKLLFDRDGQALEAAIKPAIGVGRVGASFPTVISTTRRVSLELDFIRDGKSITVGIEVIGPGERFAVTAAAKPDIESKLKRVAGPHRLSIEFDRDRLAIFVDDLVLWSRDVGPGELQSVKFLSTGNGTDAVAVNDVLVARSEPTSDLRPWADLTADAIRSFDGDETFGSLMTAVPTGVALEVKGKKLAIAWPDLAEFAFRRGPVPARATSGEHVRVHLRTADGLRDVLEGAVRAFDDKRMVLVHPILGELSLPRESIEEVRFLFHGRRLPIDSTPHHLGNRPAFGFAVPKPDGLRLAKKVTLNEPPTAGFVVVDAAWVDGKGTVAEVLVNGEQAGDLNRQADRADATVRTYRIPVAADKWQRGDNEIEVRLRAMKGDAAKGIDVRAVRVEFPVPR